jgi:hypothetical protein
VKMSSADPFCLCVSTEVATLDSFVLTCLKRQEFQDLLPILSSSHSKNVVQPPN